MYLADWALCYWYVWEVNLLFNVIAYNIDVEYAIILHKWCFSVSVAIFSSSSSISFDGNPDVYVLMLPREV